MQKQKPLTSNEVNDLIADMVENWSKDTDLLIQFKTAGVNSGIAQKGKKLSEEHCRKMSRSRTGVKRSAEVSQKLREKNLGKKHSKETLLKMSLANKGKKQSEETIRKRAAAHLGSKRSPEARKNLSLGQTTSKVVSINGVIYYCLNEASRQLGIPNSSLSRWVLSDNEKWKDWFYVDNPKKPA